MCTFDMGEVEEVMNCLIWYYRGAYAASKIQHMKYEYLKPCASIKTDD